MGADLDAVLPLANNILVAWALTWTVLPPANGILTAWVLTWTVLPSDGTVLGFGCPPAR